METSTTLYLALAALLAAFIVFTLLKGVIKMLLFSAAVIGGVLSWLLLERNGFSYIAFLTDQPKPWMVEAVAWTGGVLVFAVFLHGFSWFCSVFSFGRGMGTGGAKGILTTVLMVFVLIWVGSMGIGYMGDVGSIRYYHRLAQKHKGALQDTPTPSLFTRLRDLLGSEASTSWLAAINPMRDDTLSYLACLVAYGCTLDDEQARQYYEQQVAPLLPVPQPGRFLELFRDPALRLLVQQGKYVTLLESERLKTFLQYKDTERIIQSRIAPSRGKAAGLSSPGSPSRQ